MSIGPVEYMIVAFPGNQFKGEIVPALKELVDDLTEACERGLRLAIQGESVKRGPIPGWLLRSLDFTVTGLKKGSTTILLDAPELGHTAPEYIKQQDLYGDPGDPPPPL